MNMKSENLLSISPLDGRYNKSVESLRAITSEFGLIKYRVIRKDSIELTH